jgi:hypothetical protein
MSFPLCLWVPDTRKDKINALYQNLSKSLLQVTIHYIKDKLLNSTLLLKDAASF